MAVPGVGGLPTDEPDESPVVKALSTINQRVQHYLDKSTPHVAARWATMVGVLLLYAVRVYLLRGFYIVTYGLGIYNLNLLLGFITPQVDPELEEGPALPTKSDQEFKPFVRRLPEFKFWCVLGEVLGEGCQKGMRRMRRTAQGAAVLHVASMHPKPM
jgi:hypothetical protein